MSSLSQLDKMSATKEDSGAQARRQDDPGRAWTKPRLQKADVAALTLAGVVAMADAGGLS